MRWVLEAVSLAAVLASFAVCSLFWADLPDRIPSHFGISGQADAWASKSTIWIVPCVLAGLYALLSVAQRFPRMLNLPFYVDRSDPQVQAILVDMTVWLKSIVSLIFLWIVWSTVKTALGQAGGLGLAFLPFSLGGVTVVTVFYLVKLRKYRS